MKKTLITLLVIGGILALMLIPAYNSMVTSGNTVDNAWSDLQSQYKRRYELIENLVGTVKGAAGFEQKTLTDVINARANATKITVDAKDLTPEKMKELQAAQGQLSSALGRLMVVSEQYPNLKTNQNFLDLQSQIEGTENRVLRARELYNKEVLNYNNGISTFPRNIIASIFKFSKKTGFIADEASQNAPKVNF